jgi:hypothetical protein
LSNDISSSRSGTLCAWRAYAHLKARGLETFSTADPPIAKGVQLPDWAHSARTVWPPPRPFDPASFAPVPVDRRLSAERGLVQEEGRAMRE